MSVPSNELPAITAYIKANPAAVLSTVNADGSPQSAVVYIYSDADTVYFVTKTGTAKYQNLRERPAVCLTVFNRDELSTLQARGQAALVQDAATIDHIMGIITRIHIEGAPGLPPIAQLHAGAYAIIAIELDSARLSQFKKT